MALPLEERCKIRRDASSSADGESIPALHPSWTSEISFLCYEAPPQSRGDGSQAATDEWLERAEFILEDVNWLLQQSHELFWCQVVFDKSLHKLLDTFLASAPRPSDPIQLPKPVLDTQAKLHQRMFMVFLRMATHKEGDDDFFTPPVFGTILYNNYLFDIPKLVDLCALYGDEACFSVEESDGASHISQLLQRMLKNIFTQKPEYSEDLVATANSAVLATETILQTLNTSSLSGVSLLDCVLYCYDVCSSFSLFCVVYPPASQVLIDAGMLDKLLQIAAMLKGALHQLQSDRSVSPELAAFLSSRLPTMCARLLCCFLFRPTASKHDRKSTMSAINSVSSHWPEMLARMDDYGRGMQQQLEDLRVLDKSDVHTLLEKVRAACRAHRSSSATGTSSATAEAAEAAGSGAAAGQASSSAASSSAMPLSSFGAAEADPVAIAVSQVLDLLPDTDVELARSAVMQASGSFEKAVDLILEGKVANLSLEPVPEMQQEAPRTKASSAQSASCRATSFVLDGKGHDDSVAAVRATLDALEEREFQETITGYDQYDDDYDDTYDSQLAGDMPGAGGEDREEFVIRRLNQKAPLFRLHTSGTESENGTEDEDGEDTHQHGSNGTGNGVARSGATGSQQPHHGGAGHRQSGGGGGAHRGGAAAGGRGGGRGGQRGGGRGRGGGKQPTTAEERKSYARKEQHKSSRANHSRKSGADWKRRGMGGINAAPTPQQ
eukprot:scpid30761/ scgid33409/ Activating signal cointegrator 1 complex subunit 2; ASC-1 complex subunit p100; Trip4 complex subunit p100